MSKKKKIIISFLSFAFVALLSCGIALLPNWNPSPTTPPSDIGQEEGIFETEAATQPTNTSGKWTDSGKRATSFGGGSGTASDPYLIKNAQQLAYLAYMVNAGNDYSGKYFEQTANIDLSAYYWEPIGTASHPFSGNYTASSASAGVITNLYTKSGYTYTGLFGYVEDATISNIGISGGYIEGLRYTGGLVGETDGTTIITNCYNTGEITGGNTGGLVGYAGGTTTITNCYNTGEITGGYTGGLVGHVAGTTTITNSYNTGNVTSTASNSSVGGLVGYADDETTITNCYNTGNVTGTVSNSTAGGLVGYTTGFSSDDIAITNSYNTGEITGGYTGGLIGSAGTTTITIENSFNTGNVTTTYSLISYAGGLVGDVSSGDITITNSYNTGNVTSTASSSYVGGLVGEIDGATIITNITNCYNTGEITGSDDVGGLVGDARGTTTITNCYNTGNVTGTASNSKAGGLVGDLYMGSLSCCHNIGDISAPSSASVGAIIGDSLISSTFTRCYYYCEGASGGLDGADVSGTSENVNLLGSDIIFRSQSDYTNTALWTEPFWDFDNTWIIVNDKNGNYPVLIELTEFTLTVNPNGGTWNGSSSSQNFTQNYATTKSIPNPDAREGYTFKNWSLSGAGSLSGTTFTFSAGNTTLTAQWTPNTYSVKFYRNHSSSDTTTSTQSGFTYDQSKALQANPWTKTGYTFKGWSTSRTATTATYTNGQSVKNLTSTNGGTVNLYAVWALNSYTLTIDPNGGTLNGSTSTTTQTVSYRNMINLATPTRTGYTFKGWRVTSGDATVTETQYLWEEQSFDGVDDYIAIGRDQMYTDKITVAIIAYMDNWSLYGSRNMRLISCTEGGGWNFESNNGYIQVPIYDSGVGYKHITLTKTWSSLSSGWHEFTISFDGHNARLFIDGVMEGKSADFSSGEIGYNSTNGIFIGAEAYSTTTTPASTNLFEGIIESVIIVNDYVYGADFSQAGSFVIVHEDTTIRAIWEDTWARHYTMPEGSGTEEDPYQVSTASELAYFAYKTQIQGQVSYDYIVLTDDIDLAGYDWLPMGRARGTSTGFRGTFDGQGHTISNLNVNVSGIAKNTEYGLFGLVDSGAVIKNFSIISGQVNGFDNSTGAVAGYIWSATIENVRNYVDVVGATNVGGIVGQLTRATTISNTINNGNISGTHRVGGIVGGTEGVVATRSLSGVANTGTVTAYDCTGGIIGYGYSINISGAYNSYTATVEGDIGAYTGGIAGYLVQNCIVEGAVNTADVAGVRCVGGLLGGVANGGSLTTSYSEGLISARGSSVTEAGTLVGSASTGMAIADCYFKGTSNKSIGTYYGSLYTPASISSCYAIINGTKNVTAGTFANWVILNGMNDGNPIQKGLIFEGMTDQLPNTADLIKDWIASA